MSPTRLLPYQKLISSPTAHVQLEYSLSSILPKPGTHSDWTRFVLLSDTHSRMCDVPDGDVLLHTGDLTQHGTLRELKATMDWLRTLPHKIKIVIAGNHDLVVHREFYEANWEDLYAHRDGAGPESAEEMRNLLKGPAARAAGIVYLENEEHRFRTREGGREWRVYGSPWSPEFDNWAFGYDPDQGRDLVAQFPQTDILLTHGPPHNLLDLTNTKIRAGCSALAARVAELQPRLHVFGHIHEARGAYLHQWPPTGAGDEPRIPWVQHGIQLGVQVDDGEEKWMDSAKEEEELTDGLEIDFGGSEDSDSKREMVDKDLERGTAPGQTTLFVNAANMPSGPNARRIPGGRGKMGGMGFQPIIVDLSS
ncbi:Metallophos domain-containing protein [Mycena kentingensis (nom. inval.)]|nr:Metallophos domain-containing protein [Mycena kentingensis (nom. inval.)]